MAFSDIANRGTHGMHEYDAGRNDASNAVGGRSLLKDRAYEVIKKKIMDEEFPPGSFMAERKLALMLGMSKTPVKSALERLANEGFVTIAPQQCVLVRDLPIDEIADQYEIRAALETFVVRGLARRITAAQVESLRSSPALRTETVEMVEVENWVELDAAFHLSLAKMFGNQAIYRVMLDLRDRMHRIITRVFHLQPIRIMESVHEHCEIVDAIAAGEGEKAAARVVSHLERGRDLILAPRT